MSREFIDSDTVGYVPPINNTDVKRKPYEAFDACDRHIQVCSSWPLKKVEEKVAASFPNTKWKLAPNFFDRDDDNPEPCGDCPKTHTHFLFYAKEGRSPKS